MVLIILSDRGRKKLRKKSEKRFQDFGTMSPVPYYLFMTLTIIVISQSHGLERGNIDRAHLRRRKNVFRRNFRDLMLKKDVNHQTTYSGESHILNSTNTKSSRIVNGQIAPTGRYPYFAYLHMIFKENTDDGVRESVYNCGGSLISPNSVVTAAHCVTDYFESYQSFLEQYDDEVSSDDDQPYNIHPEDILVVIGMHGVLDTPDSVNHAMRVMKVKEIIVHPKFDLYDGSTFEYDIAIFNLDGYISEDFIKPIDAFGNF